MSRNSKMKQDLLTYLPPELTIDIFSRLPIRSIIGCKCVCKSWLELLETREFVNAHLSKSVIGIALFQRSIYGYRWSPKPYKFLEFVENSMHTVFNSSFPKHYYQIHSSVNGLLFLFNLNVWPRNNFICNPITRDYIKLPDPHEYPSSKRLNQVDTLGFGVSKKSSQYKVVRIFHERMLPKKLEYIWKIDINEIKCEVYTLGMGSWRSIDVDVPLRYNCDYKAEGTFLNGNLHWLGHVLRDGYMPISCFDLETEVFTIFSAPPIYGCCSAIAALEERLVLCDNSYDDERKEIVIWFMNEYGDDKSWTKKFIISKSWSTAHDFTGALCPIKVFEDGDILIAQGCRSRILCYSNKTKTIEKNDLDEFCGYGYECGYGYDHTGAVSYTPSFVPLNTFTMENVMHF